MTLDRCWTTPFRATRSLLLVGLAAGGLAACSEPTAPTTKVSGTLTLVPNMRPEGLTPDGSTALLTDRMSGTAEFYFYNTTTNTLTLAGSPGDASYDYATGISADLKVSAIHGKPEQAGVWSQGGGWQDLGNIYATGCEFDNLTHEQDQSSGKDISADGTVVVGFVWNGCNPEAFMHNAGGFVSLDVLGAGSSAFKVSEDGSVAGGWASKTNIVGVDTFSLDRSPAIWKANGVGSFLPLGPFDPSAPGEVLGLNADGSMATGIWANDGFYWTKSNNTTYNMGPRPPASDPSDKVHSNVIAANNKLIFGGVGDGFSIGFPLAFVWTQSTGMRSLQDVLVADGVSIPAGLMLTNVLAASNDGTIIVGTALDASFVDQVFVLKVPVAAWGL